MVYTDSKSSLEQELVKQRSRACGNTGITYTICLGVYYRVGRARVL